MKIGIVGSRFNKPGDEQYHLAYQEAIGRLIGCFRPPETMFVSGGAVGVDSWAREIALLRGFRIMEHKPAAKLGRNEYLASIFERNQKIAEDSDELYAFPHPLAVDGKGGTNDTIRRAVKLGRPVHVYTLKGDILSRERIN